MKQIYKKNKSGVIYRINVPGDCDGVGSMATGILWLGNVSDGLFYEVVMAGTSASVSMSVRQTPFTTLGQEFPYTLLKSTDNNVYPIYLSSSAGTASLVVSQSAWNNSLDYKNSIVLGSDDGLCYSAYLSSSNGTSSIVVDQNSGRSY